MPEMESRRRIADRAFEIWQSDIQLGYSEAIGKALQEGNPANDPEIARALIYTLMNVEEEPPVPARHQVEVIAPPPPVDETTTP